MKKITLWIFVLFAVTQVNAQLWTINECLATVDSNIYGPMHSTSASGAASRTAALYPSSQLTGIAGQTLNTLYYKRLTAAGSMQGNPNFKVYVKEVSINDFGSTALDWASEIATATLVFDSNPASYVGSSAGWKAFPMLTSFVYSGTQNLAVFTEYLNNSASSNIGWAYEYQGPCINTSNNNTGKYSNNTSGTPAATLTSSNYRRAVIGFDFVTVCNAPNNISSSNLTTSSIDISWLENGNQPQNGYEYYYSTTNTLPTSPSGNTGNGISSVSIGSLLPGTTYYFWVRGNCSTTEQSNITGPYSFTTSCNEVTSFNENFDSSPTGIGNLPPCWSKDGSSNNIYTNTGSLSPMSPANRLYMNITATTTAYALMPPVSNLQSNTHRLRFKAYATSANKELRVGYYATPNNPSSFVSLSQVAMPSNASVDALEFFIYPTGIPSGVNQLVFNVVEGAATTIYIDDVIWEQIPSCVEPTFLNVIDIDVTSVNLGWTVNGTETLWDIEYGPAGFSQGSGTIISANSNPFVLNNLMPNTSYEFYVRSVCNTSDLSAWSGPITFKTLCAEVISFVENFDSWPTGSGNLPDCWSKAGTSNNVYTTTSSSAPMSPSNRLYMNKSTTTTAYAILPPVSNLQANTHRLKFKAYCTTANKELSVGYFTTSGDESTYVEISLIQLPSTSISDTQEFTVIPTSIPAGVNQLVFNLVGVTTTTAYIDDVKWEINSSCAEPTALTVTSITNNSATLGWTNGNIETLWDIQYGLTNFALGTGTIDSGITINPHIINGLNSFTEYQFYVRAVCSGPENSAWAGPFTFKTKCDDLTEFSEGFDAYSTGSSSPMPDCWSKGGNASTYITSGAVSPMSPSNRLYMFASGSAGTEGYVILPAVSNLQANTHRLKFKAYATISGRFLEVGYLTDVNDVSSFIQLQEVYLPGTTIASSEEFIINPTNIPPGVKNLAIKNPGFPSSSTTAYIDDVIWEAIPACPSATSLLADNIDSSSAQLSWTEMGSATTWIIEYGITGFTQGSGTIISNVNSNPYTLVSLIPNTTYDYYVQADCGSASGVSVWSGPFTFSTACIPFTAPYLENFDSLTLVSPYTALPNCWENQEGPDFWDVTNDITNAGNTYAPNVGDHTTGSTNYMWIDSSSDILANEMVSPIIDISTLTSPYAGFWFLSENTNNSINHTIALDVWDGTSWVNIVTETGNFSNWVQVAALIPSNIPSLTKFRIYAIANSNSTSSNYYFNDLGIDDFFVIEAPSCLLPSNLTISNIDDSSADLSWNENGSALSWNIEYGVTGFTQGSGTLVSGTSLNPYSLTGLNPSTTYQVYLQSDCGTTSGTSNWIGPVSFTTDCVAVTNLPWNENFDSLTSVGNTSFPLCWVKENGDWATSNANTYNTPNSGLNYLRDSWSANNEFIWTVGFNLIGGTSYDFSSFIQGDGFTGWTVDYFYNTSQSSTGAVQLGASYTAPGNGTIAIQPYENVTRTFVPSTDGVYYFGIRVNQSSTSPWYIAFDDFELKLTIPLETKVFENSNFVAYPNPVKDVLKLSYSSEISSIKVINLLGQEVKSIKTDNTSVDLDMSTLSAGAYIVNVTIGEFVKTIKVIKQ